jgi:hypothetical protein
MAHTLKVIAGGFLLLVLCILVGRLIPGVGVVTGVRLFLPLWLFGSAVNMWIGVTRAGYSVREEAPILLLVFAAPAAVALLLLWRFSRGY